MSQESQNLIDRFMTLDSGLHSSGEISGPSYTITGLSISNIYYVRAKAINSAGSSSYSAEKARRPIDLTSRPIVFRKQPVSGGNYDIWLMRTDGTGQVKIYEGASYISPRWSPNGKKIVFVSSASTTGKNEIFIMNPNGTNVKQLTILGGNGAIFPVFYPDGTKIWFRGYPSGASAWEFYSIKGRWHGTCSAYNNI